MTVESPKHNIALLQCLRGIAALMIVVLHINTQLKSQGYIGEWPYWLNGGVDIFFVISGFIMWVSTSLNPNRTAHQFIVDRITRIVPLYWFLTSCIVVMMLVAPHYLKTSSFNIRHVIASFLFLPYPHPSSAHFWPVVIPGWTLNYEMFFYVLFSVAIFFVKLPSFVRMAMIFVLVIFSILFSGLAYPLYNPILFYNNPIMIEFLMGIAIGWFYIICQTRHRFAISLLFAGFIVLFLINVEQYPRWIGLGIPALLIVAGAAFTFGFRFAPLEKLGDWSYSLYLSHVITIAALNHLWVISIGANTYPFLFLIIAAISSIIVSYCCYNFIERPLNKITRSILLHRSIQVS